MASEKSGVVRAGGTEMWAEGDIIHFKNIKEIITIADMKERDQPANELAQAFEGKAKVLIEMGNLKSMKRDARTHAGQSMTADRCAKVAMVFRNPVQRLIVSFFLGLQKFEVPTKVFDNVENAESWLKE